MRASLDILYELARAADAFHLTYNQVIHRLSVFALSNAALVLLWVMAAMHVASNGAT